MNNCKDCKYWQRITYGAGTSLRKGICDAVNSILEDKEQDKVFEIEATAADDSGLMADLITGENFGCVHFKAK